MSSPAPPLNWNVSLPSSPLTGSLPSPGIPDHQVVAGAAVVRIDAGAARQRVVAGVAVQRVVAGVAVDDVDAVAAVQVSSPSPPSTRVTMRPLRPTPPVTVSLPRQRVHEQVLGRADVHGDRAGVAEERHALAVARVGHRVVARPAVELERVVAGLAVHGLAAVARVPDHQVVAVAAQVRIDAGAAGQRVRAGAADERVVAGAAVQDVVAGAARERLAAGAAGDRVVAVAAVEHRHVRVGEDAVDVRDEDRVVAGAALDEDRREGRARERAAHDGAVEDLDLGGVTGEEPERDAVVGAVAGDLQLITDDGGRDRRGRDRGAISTAAATSGHDQRKRAFIRDIERSPSKCCRAGGPGRRRRSVQAHGHAGSVPECEKPQ